MASGYQDPVNVVQTCEKIVEVPMVQIVERIEYIQVDDVEKWQQENAAQEAAALDAIYDSMEIASLDSPLAVAADAASGYLHPKEAYWDEKNIRQSLNFFRDNGFIVIPNAVPQDKIDAARIAVDRDGVRDNESAEVLGAITEKIWNTVKMLVKDPVFPVKSQIAKAVRLNDTEFGAGLDMTKKCYFPQDMHIDGLPNEATNDIMNFSCLIGIPLDPFTEPFHGNFGVLPGSHVRIADHIKKEGMDCLRQKQWSEPLKQISGAHSHAFLPLRVVPGQAYIAHYSTVHFVMPNFHGANPRRVMYSRIWNNRGEGFYMQADLSCLRDVFKEFPRISGEPQPIAPVEKRKRPSEAKSMTPSGPKDPFTKYNGFLPNGGDLYSARMTVKDAKAMCQQLLGCLGFTYHGADDDGTYDIYFKSKWELPSQIPSMVWTTYRYEAPFTKYDGYLPDGGDLAIMSCTVAEAKIHALSLVGCQGFCFHGADGEGNFQIHFKDNWRKPNTIPSMIWTSYKYDGPPILEPLMKPGTEEANLVRTVEKVVEVPMVQIVEKIVEVSSEEYARNKEAIDKRLEEQNREARAKMGLPPAAILDSPLSVPADIANSFYHPMEAYVGNDKTHALRFFRDNGFVIIPNAVSAQLLEAASAAVNRMGVRDNESEEVLSALRDSSVWEVVKMLVEDPQFPKACQVAKVPRIKSDFDPEMTKLGYFPTDMHIDGLPSMATDDIMNFTCLVGIPLDPSTELFAGNFGVMPGSHQRLEDAMRKEGDGSLRTKQWLEPLKRMSGAHTHPFLPLRVVPGQAYIAHYQSVHFVMPNMCGADPRRVMYFRIWNKRKEDGGFYMEADHSCLTDIWREYPAIKNL